MASSFVPVSTEQDVIGVGAGCDFLSAVTRSLHFAVLLPEEISVEDPVEEDCVHDEDDGDTGAGRIEVEWRDGGVIDGEPPRHPAEQRDPEEDEGPHVEQGHVPAG